MPRYYFHLWNGAQHRRDEEGSDLADPDAAYLEAYAAAQSIAADLIRQRANVAAHRFDVVDVNGQHLFEVPFPEVLGGKPRPPTKTHQIKRSEALASEVAEEIRRARNMLEESRDLIRSLAPPRRETR